MYRINLIKAAMALIAVATICLIGCSNKSDQETLTVATPNMDSIATQVAAVASKETGPKYVRIETPSDTSTAVASTIYDLAVNDSLAIVAFDDGVLTYDLTQNTHSRIQAGKPLTSAVWHDGIAYAGGDKLYRIEGNALAIVEDAPAAPITSLYSYGSLLMIGTESGLFAKSPIGTTSLMEGVFVTSIVADNNGLWVGTDGQGLYRYDGTNFNKRFLVRDSSLFDYVNCLDFGHGYLYLGTDSGLYVFDGGRWQTLTVASGLPSDNITAIDASGWVVYIGTEAGVITYFKDEFKPLKSLESICATVLKSSSKGLLVGTDTEGLLLRSGSAVRTLVAPKGMNDLAIDWPANQ